jgi:hypothetical protein
MNKSRGNRFVVVLIATAACLVFSVARSQEPAPQIDADDIGGVVTSANGAEPKRGRAK